MQTKLLWSRCVQTNSCPQPRSHNCPHCQIVRNVTHTTILTPCLGTKCLFGRASGCKFDLKGACSILIIHCTLDLYYQSKHFWLIISHSTHFFWKQKLVMVHERLYIIGWYDLYLPLTSPSLCIYSCYLIPLKCSFFLSIIPILLPWRRHFSEFWILSVQIYISDEKAGKMLSKNKDFINVRQGSPFYDFPSKIPFFYIDFPDTHFVYVLMT